MLSRKEIEKQTSEPVQPEHIEQDMQEACMHEHVAEQ
jgi:hypothetical protein